MNEQADLGIPFGEFFSQRSAAGDEDANLAAHGFQHLGEHEPIGQLPGERGWALAGEHLVEMRPAHGHRPAVDRFLEAVSNSALHLVVDLLVDTGNGDEDGGMELAKDAGHAPR